MTAKGLPVERQEGSPLFPDFIWQLPVSSAPIPKRAVVVSGTRGALSRTINFLEGLNFYKPRIQLVVPVGISREIGSILPENISIHKAPETSAGSLSKEAVREIKPLLEGADMLAVGDISDNAESVSLLAELVSSNELPLLLFANAARRIAKDPDLLNGKYGETLIVMGTPSLADLLGASTSETISSPIISAQRAAAERPVRLLYLTRDAVIAASKEGTVLTPSPLPLGEADGDRLAGLAGSLDLAGGTGFPAEVSTAYLFARAGVALNKVRRVIAEIEKED